MGVVPVDLFQWNPTRPVLAGSAGRRIPLRRRVNNFGDLIGPMLVQRLLAERGISRSGGRGRLLSVGSVLHLARPGDVVWGSGINAKMALNADVTTLDLRAVRGPLTRERLLAGGAEVPPVYGDPALLWPHFWPRERYLGGASAPAGVGDGPVCGPICIVPNLHDWTRYRGDHRAVSARQPAHRVIAEIARSAFVVGSSLHGVILAEAMGIGARFLTAGAEPPFKYEDYLRGTGRTAYEPAGSVAEAIEMGPQPAPVWDPQPLLDAFPYDLWTGHPAPSAP